MMCDVFVDVTRGARHFETMYGQIFKEVPVVLMADEYHDANGPRGRIIAPPLVGSRGWSSVGRNVWRVGDCIISSIARLTGELKGEVKNASMHAVTLLDEKAGYPSVEKAVSLKLGDGKFIAQWHDELGQLFGTGVWAGEDMSLVHVFATNYYMVSVSMGIEGEWSSKQLLEMMDANKGVMVLGQEIGSTEEIESKIVAPAREAGTAIPPVLIFSRGLEARQADEGTRAKVSFAIQCYEIGPSTFANVIRWVARREC